MVNFPSAEFQKHPSRTSLFFALALNVWNMGSPVLYARKDEPNMRRNSATIQSLFVYRLFILNPLDDNFQCDVRPLL